MDPTFFASALDFRGWLEQHHLTVVELWVGYYKKGSGRPSLTWPESVDQALCFGWIDGLRRSVDLESYAIRFTPRKSRSIWSRINIGRVEELTRLGLMRPAGLAAFEQRSANRSGLYSFEQSQARQLEPAQDAAFRADRSAWEFFQAQAAWYRRTAIHWVTSAKRDETRWKRLATLISDSAQGRTIGPLTRRPRQAGEDG